jgi:hypothetical protein
MNPAPSKYYGNLVNSRKDNGIPQHFLLNDFPMRDEIIKILTGIKQEEGAG